MTESERYRRVMGSFATGVAIATTRDEAGEPVGLTCNSVTSVSLDPPMVLFCVDEDALSLPAFIGSGSFALSFLKREDEELSRRFSGLLRESRFDDLSLVEASTGSPILANALAWLDCSLWRMIEAGDHRILIGEVRASGWSEDGEPLVFHRGRYRSVSP